jgi:hypothetical protein
MSNGRTAVGNDRSRYASSLARRPDDIFGTHRVRIPSSAQPEDGRALWATLTERQKPNGCDRYRVLDHDLAPNGSMSGTSERCWMEPGACNCAPAGDRPFLDGPSRRARTFPDDVVAPDGTSDGQPEMPAGPCLRTAYTGDPPPGLNVRGAFFGRESDEEVCGGVLSVVSKCCARRRSARVPGGPRAGRCAPTRTLVWLG